MRWLWSSTSSPTSGAHQAGDAQTAEESGREVSFGLSDRQRSRIFGTPSEASPDTSKSQDASSDKELDSFLKTFSQPESTDTSNNESSEPTRHERIRPDGSLDITPSTLYPRTMSCRQAFDHAFYCQSVGGKFNDIYRYGRLQSCSEQWGAFWMCMRTRTLSTKQRQESIRDYYETREEKRRKEFGSSEDVWDIRTVAVERAFDKDPDAE